MNTGPRSQRYNLYRWIYILNSFLEESSYIFAISVKNLWILNFPPITDPAHFVHFIYHVMMMMMMMMILMMMMMMMMILMMMMMMMMQLKSHIRHKQTTGMLRSKNSVYRKYLVYTKIMKTTKTSWLLATNVKPVMWRLRTEPIQ